MLTQKAYDLLECPPTSPNTFISYRRGYSTPLALYLESRLRLAGNNAVYVDKMLEPGGQWREELETKIRESKYLIVLCTKETFESEWVMKEIHFAKESGCTIIPILHPAGRDEFKNRDMPADLDGLQTIKVQDATAAEYEVAANKLLSYMGYSTY
ncbi:MAG: toll/interleukin-1 receptor domain-containing protein [Chloroflexota bacterium]